MVPHVGVGALLFREGQPQYVEYYCRITSGVYTRTYSQHSGPRTLDTLTCCKRFRMFVLCGHCLYPGFCTTHTSTTVVLAVFGLLAVLILPVPAVFWPPVRQYFPHSEYEMCLTHQVYSEYEALVASTTLTPNISTVSILTYSLNGYYISGQTGIYSVYIYVRYTSYTLYRTRYRVSYIYVTLVRAKRTNN